jgi:alpha,alpha-trehalase
MYKKYLKCIEYINKSQEELTFYLPDDDKCHIGLPNKFIAPSASNGIFKNDMFYWDSYFIILGLVEKGDIMIAKGMVDNFAYLLKRFDIIPSRNRFYNLGISQPPFFTSMVLEVYNKTKDKEWLYDMVNVAEQELNYWSDEFHYAFDSLSRYCDHFVTSATAEHESGWDMTSRFYDRALDMLPVDLNSLLYKYEKDLEHFWKILGDKEKVYFYRRNAQLRKEKINKYFWNEKEGFYFDYDYRNSIQSDFYSMAGFYPLWSGIASKVKAKKVMGKLKLFEFDGGLVNTLNENLMTPYRQWDYPNGWPNQQLIAVVGMLNYGYDKDATRIMKKWVELCSKVLDETGYIWEKYDVVNCRRGVDGRYPTQTGFGWTDGVFII